MESKASSQFSLFPGLAALVGVEVRPAIETSLTAEPPIVQEEVQLFVWLSSPL
jgi:hypothetical protein